MSIKPEETNLGQYSFKFTPYSKQDHFALCHLAKLHGTSKGQVIKMAFHEWLKDNLPKEIELAAMMSEIMEAQDDSGQTCISIKESFSGARIRKVY